MYNDVEVFGDFGSYFSENFNNNCGYNSSTFVFIMGHYV